MFIIKLNCSKVLYLSRSIFSKGMQPPWANKVDIKQWIQLDADEFLHEILLGCDEIWWNWGINHFLELHLYCESIRRKMLNFTKVLRNSSITSWKYQCCVVPSDEWESLSYCEFNRIKRVLKITPTYRLWCWGEDIFVCENSNVNISRIYSKL